MKIILAILSLAFIIGHAKGTKIEDFPVNAPNVDADRNKGNKFKEVIENFKDILRNGNETFGIPAMDPYKSDPLKLSYKSDKFRGKLNIESVDVFGTSNYVVNKAAFKMVGLKMCLGLRWNKLRGDINAYNFNGILFNLTDVYGKGNAEFTIRDFDVFTSVFLKINPATKKLAIKHIDTQFSLGSFQFYSEGIYNDRDISQVVSAIISDMAPKFIQMYQKELTDVVKEILTDFGNEFLSRKTLKDLLDLIS
ncbi:uncharacterized protein LOC117168289 [Belonocnema kinseyi]|uniref:uncharacterized protein LOC117168289 n=1 Tax=Belonocnema kinseyi TaxID=2817044 RepID=UPI00143D1A34|nr:uncharacterized protein LOC117168289 [Belonocnema kinseyi]